MKEEANHHEGEQTQQMQQVGEFALQELQQKNLNLKEVCWDVPGGAVVKNPPANAGDTGSIPGPGRSHMPWSN